MKSNQLDDDLKNLDACDVESLAVIWRRHLSDRVPDHLPKVVLARVLAYRLQVELRGGLSKRAVAYLKVIETDLRAGNEPETPFVGQRQLKPGSFLVREHSGICHRVMVLDGAYAWEGKTFASLSAVAKAITGTNWNGNRFFGLKERPIKEEEAA